jgi:glycosyl transferase family 2
MDDDVSTLAGPSGQLVGEDPDSLTVTLGASPSETDSREVGPYDSVEAYARRVSSVAAARQRFRRVRSVGSARPPLVSVVIPTLNEALNLPLVLCDLPSCVDEVVIVDGLSTDGTPEVASEILPDAKIVYEPERGKGSALRCGFEAAAGDILVMMDADGSADPSEIPAFLATLLDGADFAKGTRFHQDGGSSDITRLRAAGNLILSGSVNLLFRTDYSDLCYGYNAFWRHCLPAMSVDCTGFEVETLINIRIARAGLVVREVPSFERSRIHGQSNLRTFRDGGRVMRTILRERLRRPPHRHHEDWATERLGAPIVEAGLLSSTSE